MSVTPPHSRPLSVGYDGKEWARSARQAAAEHEHVVRDMRALIDASKNRDPAEIERTVRLIAAHESARIALAELAQIAHEFGLAQAHWHLRMNFRKSL